MRWDWAARITTAVCIVVGPTVGLALPYFHHMSEITALGIGIFIFFFAFVPEFYLRTLETADALNSVKHSVGDAINSIKDAAKSVQATAVDIPEKVDATIKRYEDTVKMFDTLLRLNPTDQARIKLELTVFDSHLFDAKLTSTALRKFIQAKAGQFQDIIKRIPEGIVEVSGDNREIDCDLLAGAHSSLRAISAGHIDRDFWLSEAGVRYLDLNLDRAGRQSRPAMHISRLFILSAGDAKKLYAIIEKQIENGIKIYILPSSAPLDARLKSLDIAIFDGDDHDNAVVSVTQFNKIELFTDRTKVNGFIRDFQTLIESQNYCYHLKDKDEWKDVCFKLFGIHGEIKPKEGPLLVRMSTVNMETRAVGDS